MGRRQKSRHKEKELRWTWQSSGKGDSLIKKDRSGQEKSNTKCGAPGKEAERITGNRLEGEIQSGRVLGHWAASGEQKSTESELHEFHFCFNDCKSYMTTKVGLKNTSACPRLFSNPCPSPMIGVANWSGPMGQRRGMGPVNMPINHMHCMPHAPHTTCTTQPRQVLCSLLWPAACAAHGPGQGTLHAASRPDQKHTVCDMCVLSETHRQNWKPHLANEPSLSCPMASDLPNSWWK